MKIDPVILNLNLIISFAAFFFLCWGILELLNHNFVNKFSKRWLKTIFAVAWTLSWVGASEYFVMPQIMRDLNYGNYLVFAAVNSASIGLILSGFLFSVFFEFSKYRNKFSRKKIKEV